MGYKSVKKTREVPKTRVVRGSAGVDAVEVYYVTEEYTETVFVADPVSYDSGSSSDSGGSYGE